MTGFPFATVGLDLDGTLLDTSAELSASVNHRLAALGHPPLSDDEVRSMVGRGARHMLTEGVHPALVEEMVRRCGGGRVAFVGDSIFDAEAARGAAVPSVAVSFGFGTGPVEALGADAVIHGYSELVRVLRELGRSSADPPHL